MNALKKLRDRLAAINAEIRGINAAAEKEDRNALTEVEETSYTELSDERTHVEARIAQLEDEQKRAAAVATARGEIGDNGDVGPAVVLSEPMAYARGNGQSYLLDVARSQIRGDGAAIERLSRHSAELEVELPKREAKRNASGVAQTRALHRDAIFEKRVNPNRTDGQGGYFVPPLWLVDEYIPFLRAGRTTANLCHNMDLPAGTDSINLPKVNTGTTTAAQTADAAAVSSTDLTDTFIVAPVRTIAGQQDIAMQLLDQSPVAFDEVVFKDLLSDYNQKLDAQVLNGTGANGQFTGLTVVSGTNVVTYTQASPTAATLYPILGQSASQIAKQRFQMPTGYVVRPEIWFWLVTQVDSTGRPLVLPKGSPGFNALGAYDGNAEGLAGEIFGIPIYVDANIVNNLGAGTNQSQVITSKFDDIYLWEGSIRSRALTEVLSGTLQVRLQVWNYAAFMPDRYLKSTSIAGGTGLISPSGF
jgi:HK97 family phage major capsid protein